MTDRNDMESVESGLLAIAENIELQARARCLDSDTGSGRYFLEDLVHLALSFINPATREQAWQDLEILVEAVEEENELNQS